MILHILDHCQNFELNVEWLKDFLFVVKFDLPMLIFLKSLILYIFVPISDVRVNLD